MKILGKTEKGFIVEISNEEIKATMGFTSTEDDLKKLDVGREITFTKALHNLSLLRDLRGSTTYYALQKSEEALKYLQTAVDKIKELDQNASEVRTKINNEQV